MFGQPPCAGNVWRRLASAKDSVWLLHFSSEYAIILFVILIYILRGIKALLGKMSKLPVLKTFDRIFGLIWSIAVTYLFVIGIALTAIEIIIIKLIPAGQEPLIQIIEESHIFSFLHSTNIIGENIAKLFNIDLLSLTGV